MQYQLQLVASPFQESLDHMRRELHLPGNIDVTPLAILLQDDCSLLAFGETIQGCTHAGAALLANERQNRSFRFGAGKPVENMAGDALHVCHGCQPTLEATVISQRVQSNAARDAEQPRAESSARLERLSMTVESQEDILTQVFGPVMIAQ